jgi:hypothetical protein
MFIEPKETSADRVQIDLLRTAGPARRSRLALSLSTSVISLARQAIRNRHPEYTERDVLLAFAEVHYGKDLAGRVRRHLTQRDIDLAGR